MRMKKDGISVIGAFGYGSTGVNGQSIKTRLLKDRLAVLAKRPVTYCDTLDWRRYTFRVFVQAWRCFRNSSVVFILPGVNGLKMLPLYCKWKDWHQVDLRYVTVGGWLPDYLVKNPKQKKFLKKIDEIYVQSSVMKKKLHAEGLFNVSVMPNSRFFDLGRVTRLQDSGDDDCLNLVFFSRVKREKGVEDAIAAVVELNNDGQIKVTLDVYGPIEKGYESDFFELISKKSGCVAYKGIMDPDRKDIYDVLSGYDCMVFPTYYPGEGFPGVVVDAFIAGLPVLASNWKYNDEFVRDGETGYLFETRDIEALKAVIIGLAADRKKHVDMRYACQREAEKYHSDKVIREFFGDIL